MLELLQPFWHLEVSQTLSEETMGFLPNSKDPSLGTFHFIPCTFKRNTLPGKSPTSDNCTAPWLTCFSFWKLLEAGHI